MELNCQIDPQQPPAAVRVKRPGETNRAHPKPPIRANAPWVERATGAPSRLPGSPRFREVPAVPRPRVQLLPRAAEKRVDQLDLLRQALLQRIPLENRGPGAI